MMDSKFRLFMVGSCLFHRFFLIQSCTEVESHLGFIVLKQNLHCLLEENSSVLSGISLLKWQDYGWM